MPTACKVDSFHATVCLFVSFDKILSIMETYYTLIYNPPMITLVDLIFLLRYYCNKIYSF